MPLRILSVLSFCGKCHEPNIVAIANALRRSHRFCYDCGWMRRDLARAAQRKLWPYFFDFLDTLEEAKQERRVAACLYCTSPDGETLLPLSVGL